MVINNHRVVACQLLVLLAVSVVWADDWNAGTGGNPARNSRSHEHGPQTADILWQNGLSATIAQPAVIEGNIIAMSRIQSINDVLHGTVIVAQSLTTGDTLWTADLPVDFAATDWRNRVSAIRNGRVYASRSGNNNYSFFYALNSETGAVLWRSQDSVNECSTESPSFAPNGDLIVGSFTNVERINATDGSRVWLTPRVSPTSNGSEAAVYGNRLYLWEASLQGPKVSSFDLTTGAPRYSSAAISGGFVQQVGLFIGPDGTVYAPRTQNNSSTDFLVALEDRDTALVERWRVPLGYCPFASFGIGPDSSVYSYTADRRVIRINPQTGSVLDSSEIIETDFFQPRMAIDSSGIVYVTNGGFTQGEMLSYDPDLTLRWTMPIPGVNIGGPAIGQNGTLIVCGTGENVIALRGQPSNGARGRVDFAVNSPTLSQNYPNPFNPSTTISYYLPQAGDVRLTVFNTLGQRVATLVSGNQAPGQRTVQFDGATLASGHYFCRLQAGSSVLTRNMLLLK